MQIARVSLEHVSLGPISPRCCIFSPRGIFRETCFLRLLLFLFPFLYTFIHLGNFLVWIRSDWNPALASPPYPSPNPYFPYQGHWRKQKLGTSVFGASLFPRMYTPPTANYSASTKWGPICPSFPSSHTTQTHTHTRQMSDMHERRKWRDKKRERKEVRTLNTQWGFRTEYCGRKREL